MYESDIVLDDEDKKMVDLSDDGDVDGPLFKVTKRNAERLRHKTWRTKRVPYEIEPKLSELIMALYLFRSLTTAIL